MKEWIWQILRTHHLSRQERSVLHQSAKLELSRNESFCRLPPRAQKRAKAHLARALACNIIWQDAPPDLLHAQERLQKKALRSLLRREDSFFMRGGGKRAPLRPEIVLFAVAASHGQPWHSKEAAACLQKVSPLSPAPIFLVPDFYWNELWQPDQLYAAWEPASELIFIRQSAQPREHIALHEMLHSLQVDSYRGDYLEEKRVLLEGLTEEAAVEMDGCELDFYQSERRAVRSLLEEAGRNLPDLLFLSGQQLFRCLQEDFACSEQALARKVRAARFS